MTATRNGRFKRAALRAVTVAGFAAAAWFAGTAAAHAAEQPETQSDPAAAFGEAHAVGGSADQALDTGEDRLAPDLVTTLLRVAPELDVQHVVIGVDAVLAVPGNLLSRPAPDDPDDPAAPIDPREQHPRPHPGPSALCGEHDPLLALVRQVIQPARRTLTAAVGPALSAIPVGVLPAHKSTVVRTTPLARQGDIAVHVPSGGDGSRRTSDLGDCAPSTTPAGGSHGGTGAPSATLAAVAVLIAPLARALRRAADSALRRADSPRPTSSPD